MAGKIVNDITLLFKTKLDEQSKQEVGRNLRALLENAAIGFDEAEIRRNLVPIVRMIQTMFDKAEIAFDADKLLAMPGRQALQALANMEVSQLQAAFDRAVAKSGGVKIDFGSTDLSAMTEPMERLAQELASVGERVASTTKKSVYEIEKAVRSIGKDKALKKIASPEKIEAALSEASSDKKIHPSQAVARLEKARELYTTSVEENNPWVVQYKYLLDFVAKYERLTHQAKLKIESERPEFAQLYEMLSPKAGAAKISLQHYVDVSRGNELSEYKNQPWARESTLQKIESTLRGGIAVKGGPSDGQSDGSASDDLTPPRGVDGNDDKTKKSPRTMGPIAETPDVDAERRARIEAEKRAQAEKAAAEAAKKRRIEEEKAAEAAKKIKVYRGIIPPEDADSSVTRREILEGQDGAEWWATNKNAAQTYADLDEGGAILVGTITPKNPLIIDAGGRNYDDFANMPGIKSIIDQFPQLTELIASKADITDVQKYINTRAKALGYDVVQFDNVNDVLNPSAFKELGSTFAVLDDSILEVSGAFAQLKYDADEGLGDYSKKASAKNIPDYYKMPDTIEQEEVKAAKDVQAASESSAAAAKEELDATAKTTIELEKQKKLLLYRRVEGELDPSRISSRSADALYDKQGRPSIQSALEMGYGGFGDGLYASSLSGASSLAEVGDGQTSFFAFDASDYKFYINKTVEQAELVRRFLLSLQKFVGAGSILDASRLGDIEDLNEKELFAAASRLFGNFDMTQEQFHAWLENAKNECQRIAELFAKGEVPEDRHNFGTRFMKELGYEGIHNATGDEYLDGEEQGTVIFDPDVDKVRESLVAFKSMDEYLEHIRQTASGTGQAVNAEIVAHKENAAAIVGEADAQERLNGAESQNPPAQDESGVHDANAEAIDHEAEAQKRLNSLEINGLYYAAKFPENHPGELEGALQNNPNLISDLAAQRDALLQKMQPVKDMASRISKMSSIKDIPFEDLYQEAANVGRQLSTMYDDGIRDTEEYVALQYKLIHIFEKLSTAYGGVKGSGAKDRSELYQWLGDSIHQRTGYNPMQDGFAVDAIWGQGSHSIAKTANKMFSVKEMAANMLDYGGIGSIAFAGDESDLSELNAVIDALAQIQQSSSAAKTSVDGLNDSLERKNATEQSDAGGADAEETNAETAAIQQQNAALQENISLQGQADGQDAAAGQTGTGATATVPAIANEADKMAISAEAAELEAIRSKLLAITDAVNAKTNAFTQEEAEVKRVAASEIQALSEVENKINAAKTALANIRTNVDSVHAPEVNAEAFTQESQAAEGAVAKEIGSIQKLRAALQLTTKRINEKTQAFEAEGAIVTKVVNSEINALRALGTRVGVINAGILDLLSNLRSAKADAANIVVPKVQTSASGDGGEATKPGKKPRSAAQKNDADESARLARLKKIETLEKEVGQFRADADAATNEGVRKALQEEIALRERMIELLTRGEELSAEEEARAIRAAELRTKEAKEVAARESKEAAKAERRTASEARSFAQSDAMLGKAKSAVGRAETTWMNAVGIDGLPDSFVAQIDEYYQKLEALRRKHQELKSDEMISPEQKQALINQTIEIDKMTGEISELIAEYQKLSGTNVDETKTRATTLTGGSSLGEYESQMRRYVQEITNGQGKIKSFDAATRTMTYTVKTGANEFTEYTASVRRLDGTLVSVQKTTKRAETFFEATARKMKEISSYFTGMMLISRVTMELRRGVQYVREIDAALTELKKVTDATEESYEKFLDTAAKTADKVGSTIQKVVSSASDWARLGSVLAKTSISPFI